jgi:methionyl aminopeptidase
MGITLNGYIVDAAFTIEMPNVSEEFKKINKITYESLIEAIKKVKSGIKVSEIGKTIQQYVEKNGYCVLRDFSGHGCGLSLHEQPYIYNYETSTDEVLEENMIVCIEPMVTTNSIDYKISSNM